jgi:hypothetical protein
MTPDLRGLIAKENRTPPASRKPMRFVPAGASLPRRSRSRVISPTPLLRGAVDWNIEIDVGSNLTFPPAIVSTSARPDIVIWSCSTKTVIWGELTCPLEELILEAHIRKRARYLKLEIECRVRGWSVHAFQFEVGTLGFVGNSSRCFLLALGLRSSQLKFVLRRMSTTSRKSSVHIWHSRRTKR